MYASVSNQIISMAHYILSFCILFIVFPKLIFKNRDNTIFDTGVRNYMRIVFYYIVCGYFLVIVKLYELIGIVLVMYITYFIVVLKKISVRELQKKLTSINASIYDVVDGIIDYKALVRSYFKDKAQSIKNAIRNSCSQLYKMMILIIFMVVLIYSAYLRLYNAVIHAAPSMSDSSVTLAWMKYISERVLFHDGIYPQGFHIYLATLHKFANINQMYILNYTGPLNGVFITLSIYFLVSRFTGDKYSGVVAMVIYGLLGKTYTSELSAMRQIATNSQEFGFIFIMPTFYFYNKYLKEGKKEDLVTAFSGICVIGLVHSIAFAFVGIGMLVLVFVYFAVGLKDYWNRLWKVCISGILGIIVAAIPLGIGKLMNRPMHASSEEYLMEKLTDVYYPEIRNIDYIAFVSIFLVFLYIILNFRSIKNKMSYAFVFLFSITAFSIWYFGAAITKSVIVANRFSDLWDMIIPVIIAFGLHIVFGVIRIEKIRETILLCSATILLGSCIFYFKPEPLIPYKVQSDAMVEQYLGLTKKYAPTEWHFVSDVEGGYALTLGYGYHIENIDFLRYFNPADEYIEDINTKVKLPDIFILWEKNVFMGEMMSGQSKKNYEDRVLYNNQMGQWIDTYKKTHSNINIYYEDKDMIIYHISQKEVKESNSKKIWGD
jgi:hypothetical protein